MLVSFKRKLATSRPGALGISTTEVTHHVRRWWGQTCAGERQGNAQRAGTAWCGAAADPVVHGVSVSVSVSIMPSAWYIGK